MDQRNEMACIFKGDHLPASWESVQRDKDERREVHLRADCQISGVA